MRTVVTQVSEEFLARRRARGQDKHDEVWDGVLHLMPPPHARHQRLLDGLGVFFRLHWEDLGLGRTYPETGVKRPGAGRWAEAEDGEDVPNDYRTPDRSFLCPERYDRVQGGWIVGGPDVVLEIRSPGDESRRKLPWYFEVGVREVVLVERDTREVEVLRRGEAGWTSAVADDEGWVTSEVLETAFRSEEGEAAETPVLHARRTDGSGRAMRIGA